MDTARSRRLRVALGWACAMGGVGCAARVVRHRGSMGGGGGWREVTPLEFSVIGSVGASSRVRMPAVRRERRQVWCEQCHMQLASQTGTFPFCHIYPGEPGVWFWARFNLARADIG